MVSESESLVYTVETAGKLLGISRATAFTLVNNGKIPSLRLGRRLVVPKAQLLALLEGKTVEKQS